MSLVLLKVRQKRGMILFSKYCDCKLENKITNKSENILTVELPLDNYHLAIITVYGPSRFARILKRIRQVSAGIVLSGDWNTIHNYSKVCLAS